MNAPNNRELLASVRAWAAANYPGCPLEYIEISCRFLATPIRLADAPCPESALQGTVPRGGDGADERADNDGISLCTKEILQTLLEAGHPLTLTMLKQEMAKRRFLWHERTLKRYLAELMEEGTIDNPKGVRPPGYRLTSLDGGNGGGE